MKIRPWRILSAEHMLDCRVFSVERTKSQSPVDASVHEFYRVRCVDWAQIVPVTDDNEIVMVRQYRHGSDELSLEIPAGLIDPGETPAEAARRECKEETGYTANELESLGVLRPNPALFLNRLHAFVTYGAKPGAAILNTATEQTEVELVPVDRVAEMILQGEIDHALDVAVLWRFLHVHS
jgi:8-oxo-dGTP pyrophosphatase MutT (NUDIX family)